MPSVVKLKFHCWAFAPSAHLGLWFSACNTTGYSMPPIEFADVPEHARCKRCTKRRDVQRAIATVPQIYFSTEPPRYLTAFASEL